MREPLRSVFGFAALALSSSLTFSQNLEVKTPTDLSSRNRDVTEATRDQVRSGHKALVVKAMKMTDAEALAFWPVYDDYANEMTKTDDRTVNLVTNFADNYKNLSDAEALRMTGENLSLDRARLAVKQRYAQRFAIALPEKGCAILSSRQATGRSSHSQCCSSDFTGRIGCRGSRVRRNPSR